MGRWCVLAWVAPLLATAAAAAVPADFHLIAEAGPRLPNKAVRRIEESMYFGPLARDQPPQKLRDERLLTLSGETFTLTPAGLGSSIDGILQAISDPQ